MTGDSFPPGVMWLEDEAGQLFRTKAPLVEPGRFADLIKSARACGLAPDLRLTLPLQQPTLDALTRAAFGAGEAVRGVGDAMGKMALQVKTFADSWRLTAARNRRRAARRAGHPRTVPSVPNSAPAGLSRVDAARARSARSALLRSARRAARHNRALPPRRPVTFVVQDPKITWGDEKAASYQDCREDRLDAVRFALASRP